MTDEKVPAVGDTVLDPDTEDEFTVAAVTGGPDEDGVFDVEIEDDEGATDSVAIRQNDDSGVWEIVE